MHLPVRSISDAEAAEESCHGEGNGDHYDLDGDVSQVEEGTMVPVEALTEFDDEELHQVLCLQSFEKIRTFHTLVPGTSFSLFMLHSLLMTCFCPSA